MLLLLLLLLLLVQDFSNSTASALELLQFYTKPLMA